MKTQPHFKDAAMQPALEAIRVHNERQREWLFARSKQAAPQVLVVPTR